MTVQQEAEQGERQAIQLADRLRALAKTDPGLAQHLVDELIENLTRATGGALYDYLAPKQGESPDSSTRNT